MASHRCLTIIIVVYCLVVSGVTNTALSSSDSLSPDFYDHSCPHALQAIQTVVRAAVSRERRMGASLLRLHFHDCFVNGCDGSILLDDSEEIESEKKANPNVNSARGFEVIDDIKREVDRVCGAPLVSCADILAVAARDSVVAMGGPSWKVRLGRRDSKTASLRAANEDIPAPFFSLSQLIDSFKKKGLNEKDLVVLSGGHTIGFAQCQVFRDRIHNRNESGEMIDPSFARDLQRVCPTSGGDSNLAPLDPTPTRFDQHYFSKLLHKRGLLHSDQQLFTHGGSTDGYVKKYSYDAEAFFKDFATSMVKMGNIEPLTGYQGEIRCNCRMVN